MIVTIPVRINSLNEVLTLCLICKRLHKRLQITSTARRIDDDPVRPEEDKTV